MKPSNTNGQNGGCHRCRGETSQDRMQRVVRERDVSYNREVNFEISKKIVIQSREVRATTRHEGDGGLDMEGDDILAVNDLKDLFARLGDLVAQSVVVLDNVGGAPDGGGSGDVV